MKKNLTINRLKKAAENFCEQESTNNNSDLYGVTDGKAVGTYIEHKFQDYLSTYYNYQIGSSAKGIDLPESSINTDIKVTSITQPQSSCPFKDVAQKIYGLGYNLIIFVYEKKDNPEQQTAILDFVSCAFLNKEMTGDYTITRRLREMIEDNANKEDIVAYLTDRNIPGDDITLDQLAERIIQNKPSQGYLTISNALQWRLQYSRIVYLNERINGISKLIDKINQ